ncbi:AAA family ATPase [Crenothrix sp.]|uniref:AAA family ATPase n=1 Tax=Crenothrix sp. TaxID=3100433 RepID=UPI00374D01E5
MRFQRLDLIKYGKFSDRCVEFPAAKQDFHLIVGPNEAGKSTLRSAIIDLLFGMHPKSQLSFLHPLKELRLGASIANALETLEFHRTKAQKQTLRSPLDAVLADNVLSQFLGTGDRNFFEKMFGLDHTMLVKGGESILNAQDDVGQVLFQAAAGVAGLGKVRDALLAEADKLWAPRKANDRAYYAAADQLDKATVALKEATVRTKVWADANNKVEELHDKITREREHHQQFQGKRNSLERVRRLAPILMSLKTSEQAMAELGDVIELPADAAATLAKVERELAIAQERLALRTAEVETAQGELGEIEVDTAVLDVATDISKLDELRLQYGSYEMDIERQELTKSALWRDVCEACVQLGWQAESQAALAKCVPTPLVRRELNKLAHDFSGLAQGVKAAEHAEKAKLTEIESLAQQLAALQTGEIKPALRAALASARSLGDPDAASLKQQTALTKTKSLLEDALQALGQWRMALPDLTALKPPSQQTLSRLLQERQSLVAECKATVKQREDQKTKVAGLELSILQFKERHHPITHEDVIQARYERDASWEAIKTGETALSQAAQAFEATLLHADAIADTRLNNVEAATQLQSLNHQFEREVQALATIENQSLHQSAALEQFDGQCLARMQEVGLTGLILEDTGDWLAKRDKALAAATACRDAQAEFTAISVKVAEFRLNLAKALQEAAQQVADHDSLSALCVQAENFIQDIDRAKTRQQTLSGQYQAAKTQAVALQQAAEDAKSELKHWNQAWSQTLVKAGLSDDSDIGSVEGALALIDQIENKLKDMRLLQERIDAMTAELAQFAVDADRLAQLLAPELKTQPASQIAQVLAKRLTQARATATEATRLTKTLRDAKAQVVIANDSIRTASASLKPMLERVGVDSNVLLAEAIGRSDQYRRLKVAMEEGRACLMSEGDGLARVQLEAEIDAVELVQLVSEIAQIDAEINDIRERERVLLVDHTDAKRVLAEIGGSDAAAQAEAQRQEALARMSDVAERYIKVFTAGRLLRWSIDRYREEKQGPLLARASLLFSGLTLGSFQRLSVDFDKNPPVLEGQRADGKLVGIAGLSDGTRDQLYLALRLASLEMHLEQAMPLPFIADDLFINYDDARSKAGLEALAGLSERTQVIFLSHHDHLIPLVQEVFGGQVNIVEMAVG